MIGYLRGTIAGIRASESSRKSATSSILTLDVQGVGYDLIITNNAIENLAASGTEATIYTHLQVREDQMVLFGFLAAAERDLFRQLISVSGLGTQMAIALLNTLGLQDLVKAIVTGNARVLSLTPGVGKKTAERISLELRSKLADWRQHAGVVNPVVSAVQEDLEMALLAFGYTAKEINAALGAIATSPDLVNSKDVEAWLKAAIGWLSKT
ncbi:Holliday junction DNA helicase subunit RuvA [Thalassoporum mexicanum PCC 7367]|uniref:Holliday junction branch migration protein RuvA n=1 Tax=Thalassoporum mexicanum TaxID=3457544 RepID=UPI00029FD6CE|nr:Holliday junction branch migration protein RuvA [Pseudanabaena sp. PCC 7367]AFY69349.1 Holliday junction DNA helicase subunit RuvA [Pseudanabaena sp. PCC 7367]